MPPRPSKRIGRAFRLAFVAWAGAFSAPAPGGGDLNAIEQLGRKIYTEGRNALGSPVAALVGIQNAPVSGGTAACANCHGADGRGRPEGGVVPPDITWEELSKPYGHAHDGARKHGPFDERAFARVIAEGIDPGGNRLLPAMPRYSLAESEVRALAAYLARLSKRRDPGVVDALLRVGSIAPEAGPGAAAASAMHAVLRAYFADLNETGGIHGRTIELVVARDFAEAGTLFKERAVFALVAPFAFAVEDELVRFAVQQGLPVIGPYTLSPPVSDAGGRIFYLLSGLPAQARVLVEYAVAALKLGASRNALAVGAGRRDAQAAQAIETACTQRGCGSLARIAAAELGDGGTARRLMEDGVQTVFFIGGDEELSAFLATSERIGWKPQLLVVGSSAARVAIEAPESWSGRLYLSYPSLPNPSEGRAARAFETLLRDRGLESGPRAAQSFAYASASIFVEGLRRAGRDLSRERLMNSLEALYRFDAGPVPAISYGPGRRIGALGGYVVAVHPRQGFRAVSSFIELE